MLQEWIAKQQGGMADWLKWQSIEFISKFIWILLLKDIQQCINVTFLAFLFEKKKKLPQVFFFLVHLLAVSFGAWPIPRWIET